MTQSTETAPDWRPSATREMLARRAELLRKIRQFMDQRSILEVETPILSQSGATDPNLESLITSAHPPHSSSGERLYLHTSPEFAMKRLVAAGTGPIYQIVRVFRDAEMGRFHQLEFTMLEWYRPGFDHHRMMDETEELLGAIGLGPARRVSYAEAFESGTGLDPHGRDTSCLVRRAAALGFISEPPDRSVLLDFLFSELVAPRLGRNGSVLLYDFPASQAALAKIRPGDPPVAERFELLIGGLEIANGFHELSDSREQRRRFEADNRKRTGAGHASVPLDERLLGALSHGLPDCAGVAMGLDRLLMALNRSEKIEEVLSFPFPRA